MTTLPPNGDPLNPAELPVEIPPLPTLPPSVSNLLPPETIDVPAVTGAIENAVGIKPGNKTTEFWASIVTAAVNSVAAIWLLLAHKVSPDAAVGLLGVGNGAIASVYTLARSYLKTKITVGNAPVAPTATTTVVVPSHPPATP